jgi:hypothetical protein
MYQYVVLVQYPLRDPDSTLYESISVSLRDQPFSEWLTPRWPANRLKTGLFVEHLPFFFWPSAALARLGFERPALLANLVYFLAALYLLFLVTCRLTGAPVAWLAAILFAVSPAGIMYLLRANHESAWAAAFLGALYCLVSLDRGRRYGTGLALFALAAFLVKGILSLVLFPVLALWWWRSSGRDSPLRYFAFGLISIGAVSLGYEFAYRHLTGHSFFGGYLGAQMAYVIREESHGWLRKLFNPLYYAVNILWFAFPSSMMFVYSLWRNRRLSEPARLISWACGGYAALVSLMTRRAARYIFPVYLLLQPAGAEAINGVFPKLGSFFARYQTYLPYLLMSLLCLILVARVQADLHFYRFIQVFER